MVNEFYDWWMAQVEAAADAADTDTEANVVVDALDNEAYRRDFPEVDRWEDEGGSYRELETTKFGDAEPSSVRIYEPGRKTLGELIDEKIDLTQTVSEDAHVRVTEGSMYRYLVIVVERTDDE